jgi:hypothetical protein
MLIIARRYNALQDRILKLGLIPSGIYTEEANYYLTKETTYGIPFVSTHSYTKTGTFYFICSVFIVCHHLNGTLHYRLGNVDSCSFWSCQPYSG